MKRIILLILFYSAFSLTTKQDEYIHQAKQESVLIIGSSVPALISALLLTDNNISVTIVYASPDVDNSISAVSTLVEGITYRLPKYHPDIFEHSTMTRNIIQRFGNSFSTKEDLYLYNHMKKGFSISKDESTFVLLINALAHECLDLRDFPDVRKIESSLKDYDYSKYRTLYSNISLAQFAKLFGAPKSFVSCFLNSSLINWGANIDQINAADAIGRMQYYYLSGKNGLRSYHMINNYASMTNTKILVDQIIQQLKIKKTIFVSNYSIEALWVDPDLGVILGDINKRSVKYDYVILADTLNSSKRLLDTTRSYNTGAPKIFDPLDNALNILNQYSNPPRILSIKIWFSKDVKNDRDSIINVNNSPFPNSIQSVRQINKLCGSGNPGNILEIILADTNQTEPVNWTKIIDEMSYIFPDIKNNNVEHFRIDSIDTGTIMDLQYGKNRFTTTSILKFGIPNLILAADWLDTESNVLAYDLEKSVILGHQAASLILKNGIFFENDMS